MAKKLAVRVDDRLIHGQVVTQWVKVFHAQKIVVIDDQVAIDKMQKSILKFAAPPDLKVSILSVEKAAEDIHERKQIYKQVGLSDSEALTLMDIEKRGVKLCFQMQPTDRKESLEIMRKTFPNLH